MHPILARYGPFFLYSYTVVLALGLAAAVGLTAWLERHGREPMPGWIDGLIVAALAGLVGGRAGFILANWDYFAQESGQIALVWRGGLSYHGVLLAGLLGLFAWSAWQRRAFTGYAGLLAPALVLFSAFGWLACYLEGCAYGQEATFGPLAADLPDSYGVFALRYQTQLMGLVLCLLLLPAILYGRRRLRPGPLFWLSLALLSAIRAVVSFFRGDEAPHLGSWRWDTVLDASVAVVAILFLLVIIIRQTFRSRQSA
ncbi:MAG: prolipoprotein diacylglyceryl transferase [Candidatus Promineifilaceae bacterium]|jgi:phosphatidylglycerol:prolipoprotein diacylglycerol transferase